METILQTLGIIFLFGVLLLWAYSFYKGRRIVKYLQRHHQTKWEELGSPQPDYLSGVYQQQWSKFISQKGYLSFQDKELDSMCRIQQRLEKLTLTLTLIFFIVFGGIAIWYKYAT